MKNLKLIQLSVAAMLAFGSSSVFAEMVNINKASAQTIAHHLSGIGIKKAAAIVKYRNDNGVFKSVDDLTEVKGIGDGIFKKIKADLSLTKGVTDVVEKPAKKVVKESLKKKDKALEDKEAVNKVKPSAKEPQKTTKKIKSAGNPQQS